VLLNLGVRGDGGLPLRVGIRDGHTRDRIETPLAIAACLVLGLEGVRGLVADRQAYRHRTLGRCLEHGSGWVPLVPRTWAVRQALAAWGPQPSRWPVRVETPGRTRPEESRRWDGHSVLRQVPGDYRAGRVTQEARRCVVVHSSPLAHQQAYPSAVAHAKEAAVVAAHVTRVEARRCACVVAAAVAIAAYAGRGHGRRGRRPRPWRSPAGRSRVGRETRRPRGARRGRPAKTARPRTESCSRRVVAVESLDHPEEEHGWTVLATTVPPAGGSDVAILQAYQAHQTTVAPGLRWIKNPAAISPVWREKPERMAAWARLIVMGWLVYAVIQRQVRRSLLTHAQQIRGNTGETATPTAAVVWSLCAPVASVQ
jgi:hypothetical protein